MKQYLFIDWETEGLNPFKHRPHGFAAAMNMDKVHYYPADKPPQWAIDAVADPNIIKVGSNIRGFDFYFNGLQGWKVAGPLYDTALMSKALDDSHREHGLKQLTERLFGKDSLKGKNRIDELCEQLGLKHVGELCVLDLADPSRPYYKEIAFYGCEDVENQRNVFLALKPLLEKAHKEDLAEGFTKTRLNFFKDLTATESVLLKMELAGVRVDKAKLEEIRRVAVEERDVLLNQLTELCKDEIATIEAALLADELTTVKKADAKQRRIDNPSEYGCTFNLASAPQLGALIYETLGCDPDLVKRGKSGTYTTKEDHLKVVQASAEPDTKLFQCLELYFDIKKYAKLISTYTGTEEKGILSLLHTKENGETWLYPQYNQRPATARLACFPLHQLPGKHKNPRAAVAKKFFIPSTPDHCFVYSDLKAIEFGNAAHLSQDAAMLETVRSDRDPHNALASRIYRIPEKDIIKDAIERAVSKECNYLALYGGEEGKLMMTLALKYRLSYTKEQCKAIVDENRRLFPGYYAYLQSIKEFVEKHGYVHVETGQKRYFPDIVFGKYLNHQSKTFYGPYELYSKLLDHPGQKLKPSEVYYRARGRYRHALNSAYNAPNQGLGGAQMKNALAQLDKEGFDVKASIHDATISEVLKSEAVEKAARIQSIMEQCYPTLSVPIRSDTKILLSFSESDLFVP